MAVKAVEMVRKIRDQHYEETRKLSVEEQIEFVRKKAGQLRKGLKKNRRKIVGDTVQTGR